MKTSDAGVDFIENFEKFSATVYKDQAGKSSIGYGHKVLPDESFPDPITEDDADDLIHCDLACAEAAVNEVDTSLEQAQFDALVSFVFNVGVSAFANSTMLKLLNSAQMTAAAAQFLKWIYFTTPSGVKLVSEGLQARRLAEQNLFLTGVYDNHN